MTTPLAIGRTKSDTDATASWRTPPEDLDALARLLRVRWAVDDWLVVRP